MARDWLFLTREHVVQEPMAESTGYLAEQLERVRQMIEQMARVSEQLSEATDLASRDADLVRSGPLQAARDLHIHHDQAPRECSRKPQPDTADDRVRRAPRRRRR